MYLNFWQSLPKPFFVLAPMSNITDAACRSIIAKYGKPDVIFTEFISVNGLCSRGAERLLPDMWFQKEEKPIVVQFFGNQPWLFYKCAKLAAEKGFSGIDINAGCPDKAIVRHGSGADLIQSPALTQELIYAAKEGANGLPVSIKSRIGYNNNTVEDWIPTLLEAKPAAISIHGRTRSQRYKGFADWEAIKRVAEIAAGSGIPIIGNGDITSYQQGLDRAKESGVDGLMIGRAIMGNPWIFNPEVDKEKLPQEEVLNVLLEHAQLFEDTFKGIKRFKEMRKHLKSYVSEFEGAKTLRYHLVQSNSAAEVKEIVEGYYNKTLTPPSAFSKKEITPAS